MVSCVISNVFLYVGVVGCIVRVGEMLVLQGVGIDDIVIRRIIWFSTLIAVVQFMFNPFTYGIIIICCKLSLFLI